jgi:hypothetical protein
MAKKKRDYATNHEINKGSVLLLFDEADARIARSWRKGVNSGNEINGCDPIAPQAFDARR